MEYISREALLRYLNDIWLSATPNDFMPDDDRQLAMVRCIGLNDAMDAVKEAPAADMRPVVKARWVEEAKNGVWHEYCSNCHEHIPKGKWGEPWHSSYCPNCGAMMEES